MPSRDPEKRPKGLRALSAFKANGFRSKKNNNSEPPSPQDDTVDVPDYLAAETIPPIPGDKQLPPAPPLPLNHIQRREVPAGTGPRKESLPATNGAAGGLSSLPMQIPMGMGMDDGPMSAINRANGSTGVPAPGNGPPMGDRFYAPMERPAEDAPMDRTPMPNGSMDRMPMHEQMGRMTMRNGPMDRMPMNHIPRDDSPIDPMSNEPSMGTPRPPSAPMRTSAHDIPTNQVPRNSIQAATVPHAPQPIRPPSIPVVERIPSDESVPRVGNNEDSIDANVESTDNEATPTASQENAPWMPPEVEPVAAPLNFLHYDCYQEHRAMPVTQNVWYPVPCMTCQKHDQEIRHRCVFCCLRVCVGCFQALQKCQRRSLQQLMESIQS